MVPGAVLQPLKELTTPQPVGRKERGFKDPAPFPDLLQEGLMQDQNLGDRAGETLPYGPFLQAIHQLGHLDLVGATGGAGLTARADPDGPASQDPVFQPQEHRVYHCIGRKIHGLSCRAAAGALSALKAVLKP